MKTSTRNLVVVAIVAAVVGSVFSTMANSVISRNDEITDTCISQDNSGIMRVVQGRSLETDFTKAAESTVNAVVSIKSYVTPRRQQYYQSFDPFEFFFGPGNGNRQQPQQEQKPQQSGLGSGVIISNDGYIVTNNHVVEGAEKLEVTLNDNRSFNAQVIGTDPTTDLALLKIEAKDLSPISIGDSDDIKVGEWVLAVGNPFGFTSTVTAGIVSAKARSISSATHSMPMGVESFIQTDAAVNPGNSGGALVTTDGLLVGINTAIYSTTGNYAGYSFAIPSNIVKKVITDIKQYGTVQRAVLGISFQDLTAEIAKERDITAVTDGIIIEQVLDRGSAKEAGLEKGDVIIKINDAKIKDKGTMMEQMSRFRPGDKIKVTYVRDNKTQTTTITLKNSQGNTSITKSNDIIDLGCAFKELTDKQKKDLGISKGVEVLGVKDGKFKDCGIRNGFIILDINNYPVSSREDVEKVYKAIMNDNDSDKVMFITGIYPTGKKVYYAVPLVD
ncbi:MAG: Do family serine endopeptidase [Muribaculaceae bacterium]